METTVFVTIINSHCKEIKTTGIKYKRQSKHRPKTRDPERTLLHNLIFILIHYVDIFLANKYNYNYFFIKYSGLDVP